MTKLTLELPASAAAKLANLTPEQLKCLSDCLGYEVKSVTVQPSEHVRKARANAEIYTLTTKGSGGYPYLPEVPWAKFDEILSRHGFDPIPEGHLPLSLDKEGGLHVPVNNTKTVWLLVTWYRMSSGSYEVVAYVS